MRAQKKHAGGWQETMNKVTVALAIAWVCSVKLLWKLFEVTCLLFTTQTVLAIISFADLFTVTVTMVRAPHHPWTNQMGYITVIARVARDLWQRKRTLSSGVSLTITCSTRVGVYTHNLSPQGYKGNYGYEFVPSRCASCGISLIPVLQKKNPLILSLIMY